MNNISFKFDDINTILKKRGLDKGGRVQQYIDSEVLRLSAPYTPHAFGDLSRSGIRGTVVGSGLVVWKSPYARYQYYGKVMVGKAPKTVTSTDLTYQGGGLRGSFWFERMKADSLDDIIRGVNKIVGGKA